MADGEEPKTETSEDDADAMEEIARMPSTMPAMGIDLTGYATEDFERGVSSDYRMLLSPTVHAHFSESHCDR